MHLLSTVSRRILTSLTTFPTPQGWFQVAGITALTTASAGLGSVATGFIHPFNDFSPPHSIWKPLNALIVPGILEEIIWRAALLPTPEAPVSLPSIFYQVTTKSLNSPHQLGLYKIAMAVLVVHVCSHPVFSATVYPRGKQVFSDPRFLFLATIVLGGATLSYIVSGGSVWAAAVTHGVPVALWRDFFGGEQALVGDNEIKEK